MANAFKRDANGWWVELKVGETKDFGHDWSAELGTDSVQNSTWSAETGITVSTPQVIGAVASAFFSGAAEGVTKWIDNTITTVGGRVIKESFRIVGKLR